jgi:hypothetical protein
MKFYGPVRNEKRKYCLRRLFKRLMIELSHQKLLPRHHDGSSFPGSEQWINIFRHKNTSFQLKNVLEIDGILRLAKNGSIKK